MRQAPSNPHRRIRLLGDEDNHLQLLLARPIQPSMAMTKSYEPTATIENERHFDKNKTAGLIDGANYGLLVSYMDTFIAKIKAKNTENSNGFIITVVR